MHWESAFTQTHEEKNILPVYYSGDPGRCIVAICGAGICTTGKKEYQF
jgi:hypothetical protein